MSDMIFETCNRRQTLFDALLDARALNGRKQPVCEDVERNPISYGGLILGSLVLGRQLARSTGQGEYVGVMLPNSVGAVVTFFALQAFGRAPAMLNFSTYARDQGIAELMVPKTIHAVDAIPVLGSGKVDYGGIMALLQ